MTPAKTKSMINSNRYSNVDGTQKTLSRIGTCALIPSLDVCRYANIEAYTNNYAIGLVFMSVPNSSSTGAHYLTVCNKSTLKTFVYPLDQRAMSSYYPNIAIEPIPESDQALVSYNGKLQLLSFSGSSSYTIIRTYTGVSIATNNAYPVFIRATKTRWAMQQQNSMVVYYGKINEAAAKNWGSGRYASNRNLYIMDEKFIVWPDLSVSSSSTGWTLYALDMDTKESSSNSGTISGAGLSNPPSSTASGLYDRINNLAFISILANGSPLFVIKNHSSILYTGLSLSTYLADGTLARINQYARCFTDSSRKFVYTYSLSGSVTAYNISSLYPVPVAVSGITKNFIIVEVDNNNFGPAILSTPTGNKICLIEKTSPSAISYYSRDDYVPVFWNSYNVKDYGNDDVAVFSVSYTYDNSISSTVKFVGSQSYLSPVIA